MLTAVNIDGNRITPFSNDKGFCPLCKSEVVKAVGEIYTPHFRHKTLQNCDTWSEGETEWHYNWKQKFPLNWQEVVIEKNGELHRADIKTDSGLILELQNSSISTTTIEIREDFYQNMIWLINAEKFKNNFNIRSLVTQRLRESESNYSYSIDYNPNQKTLLILELEEKLKDKNSTHKQVFDQIDSLYRDLKLINDKRNDFDNFLKDIIKGYYVSYLFSDFKTDEKSKIKMLNQELIGFDGELEKCNNILKQINSLPNCTVKEYSSWKVLKFEMVSPANYINCKVIFKDTAETFFPDAVDVLTVAQFQTYKRNAEKYILIFDLAKRVSDEEAQIKGIENRIEDTKKDIENLSIEVSIKLKKWLDSKDKEITDTVKDKIKIKDSLEIEIIDLAYELGNEIESEENYQIEASKKITERYKKEQLKIKMENKGQYTYHWKNKRKTWEYANMPVYLDFGDYIFEILSDYKFAKISIEDFITRIKNT